METPREIIETKRTILEFFRAKNSCVYAKKGVWRKHGKTKKTAQKEKTQQHRKQRGRIDIILKVSTSATQDEFW